MMVIQDGSLIAARYWVVLFDNTNIVLPQEGIKARVADWNSA